MSTKRKNKENFGQEIVLSNITRKFKSVLQLVVIFIFITLVVFACLAIRDLGLEVARQELYHMFSSIHESSYVPKIPMYLKKLLLPSFVISCVVTILIQVYFFHIGRAAQKQEILDGSREETIDSINKKIYNWIQKWKKIESKKFGIKYDFLESCDIGASKKDIKRSIFYGKFINVGEEKKSIFLPEDILKTHIGVEGATGTGKTVLINSILHQIRKNHTNTQACILDFNGQFYELFGREDDIILSINDKRAAHWNPWTEDIEPEKIAQSLIEDDPKDKFFAPAARSLFSDLMTINKNVESFWSDMTSSKEKIYEKLYHYKRPSADDFAGTSGNQGASVRRTMTLSLDALRNINHWSKNKQKFSIIDWSKKGSTQWIFIIVREEDHEKAKPWIRTWMDLVISGTLMRDAMAQNNATWLIADECPLQGKLPSLEKGITNGRKYNFRSIIGYQTEGQIDAVYEKHAPGIKNSIRTKFIFNPGDPESAERCAKTLGRVELYDPFETESYGTKNSSINAQNQIRERFLIHPEKLRSLDKMECYLRILIFYPVFLRIPLVKYQKRNKAQECENPPRFHVQDKEFM